MLPLSLGEIAQLVGGRLRDADPGTVVSGSVEYDSRKLGPGGLFVAFPGEQVDGHDYVRTALDLGAVAAMTTRQVAGPRIEVADGLRALTALASAVARRLPATVIGITGSSGKTSTKDLLAQLLVLAGPTIAPTGSMNNELGHPYTVLRADAQTRFLVLELGARGIGQVRHLARIAPPRIGVVLNVGTAHVGLFGTREVIARAKGELVESLPADGLAVLNADDPLVLGMAARTSARVVTVGESADADVRAEDVTLDELGRPGFVLRAGGESASVQLRLVGAQHVGNALAVVAVASAAGLSLSAVARALGAAVLTSRWRMEVTERNDGVTIINDAYNANPESTRAALEALASLARTRRGIGGRSFAVLGPMAELGRSELVEHNAVGRLAARLDIARVIAVGPAARPIQQAAALEGSWGGDAQWVPDVDAAVAALRAQLRPGDVVLVKASRAASLERVALAIAQDAVAGPEDERGGGIG
ncbi:MAG: UDP-N-acetylmuramoyl-tripeptide--D-alanyl-D-alanine ligase [Actinomycetota bacterium]|nr:UDP-N-acetylmuramoyl-tripeptide--D-alanyl-D-alanine ligase [Actinomycetota bacterium]